MKIGILSGGQLGRMLALAGIPLGYQFRFWDTSADAPAKDVGELITSSFDTTAPVKDFVAGLDCVTYEFENVPLALMQEIAKHCQVFPSLKALEISQDRLNEKTIFQNLGIECAPFAAINSLADLHSAAKGKISLPGFLKTRRMGYDGKGQERIKSSSDIESAWEAIGKVPAIFEGKVDFNCEVSLLCAQARDGSQVFYPLVENKHTNGILSESRVPSTAVTPDLQIQAEAIGTKLLRHLEYVGLLTVEFFVVSGKLVANEIAPRVHNSGHWSIEGAETSQFENHIRAISGAPLGSTALRGPSVMLNLVGDVPEAAPLLKLQHTHLHLYRKSGRARRKIGHITYTGGDGHHEHQIKLAIAPYLKF